MEDNSLKEQTRKGLYWQFFNQAANQLMQFVVGIVMARLLSPEDFGITALPAVFIGIANTFVDCGFGQALVRKQDLTEKDLSTSFYYNIVMGLFFYVCIFISAPYIAQFYDRPVLTPLVRVTALNFIWGPLGTPLNVILLRKLDFKTPARISVINKVISAVIGITAAFYGFGLWSLIISGLTSTILGLVQTWLAVRWLPSERFNKESFKYLWNYGNKLVGANIVETIYLNVAPIFIGKVYSPASLGLYNRADGYAKLPVNHLMGLLNGVTFPVLSKLQHDHDLLSRTYRRMMRLSSFIAFPVLFLLAALARPLVIVMITEKWADCIIMLQILCLSKMWWPIMSLNRTALQVIGRSDLYFKMELFKRSVNVLILIAALQYSVVAFCWASVLEIAVALVFNTHYTGTHLNVGLLRQLRDVMPMYVLSFMMFLLVMFVNHFIPNLYLQILVGGIVGTGFYCGTTHLLKFDEWNDVLYMLKRKL